MDQYDKLKKIIDKQAVEIKQLKQEKQIYSVMMLSVLRIKKPWIGLLKRVSSKVIAKT